jgi:hypothetical protein
LLAWQVLCAFLALYCADMGAALVIGLIYLVGGVILD